MSRRGYSSGPRKIDTVVSIAIGTNARYSLLAPRILQVRRPIAAVHEALTFSGESGCVCRFLFPDKPFVDTQPFTRFILSI
jgi:hypothetical protein